MHEIDDSKTLKSYIGFFALIWLTWYQVTLFDVRFSTNSLWDRAGRLGQFGVMIGLGEWWQREQQPSTSVTC